MIGRTISHYRVVSHLGAGGMGVVYGGDDTRLGRPVALKFIPEELARDQQAVERFRIEARTASALNHANICTIYDIGEHEGQPFIVMEWMKGQTLRDRITRGLLKIHQIVDIGIEIADALDAAHAQAIVHRDIKPANIFLTDRGHVKVMDFGLAKLLTGQDPSQTTGAQVEALTLPGVTLGTVSYMSPEQAAGDDVDVRTDLFSLGVVLYECATGHRPFTGNSTGAIFSAILNKAPVAPVVFNPDMPMRLQEVINNCLEKDPDLRYQTAADLRADLKRVKRDLESGRSAAVVTTGEMRTGAVAPMDRGSGGTTLPLERTPLPPAAASSPASGSVASAGGRLRVVAAVIAAVALGAAVTSYVLRPRVSTSTATAVGDAPATTFVESRAELATRSFQARQYRAARSYAEEVLGAAPDHAGARTIRDESDALLRRFDAAIQNARAFIKAGDARGAARALDEARGIDPVASDVVDVSALLANQFKGQADAARQDAQRSRAPVPPPSPAPPQLTTQATAPTPVPIPPAPPAAPREAAPQQTVLPRASPVNPPPAPPAPAPVRAETPAPVQAPASAERPPTVGATPAEADEAAIRKVVATYARAIETKDLALFRSVKPSLGAEEERRIQQGFRAVSSQQVSITILSIERRGDQASLRLSRRDVIEAGGRRQAPESLQSMTLAKTNGNWVIVEIGR